MPSPFPNPERTWAPPVALLDIPGDAVVARLGRMPARVERLGGGLANLNLRVDDGPVLRIYRRDPAAAAKEAALLRRAWAALRVPPVLDEGADWLLLGWVEPAPLLATAETGRRLGRALAEIHAEEHATAGLLDAALRVGRPFPDFPAALREHVATLPDRQGPWRDAIGTAFDAHAPRLAEACARAVRLHGDFKPSNLHAVAADARPLVLDWEFAYAGPPLMDVGQLFRWSVPPAVGAGFARGYAEGGGKLPEGWLGVARLLDLGNLAGLLAGSAPGSKRERDVRRRIARGCAAAGTALPATG